MHRLLLAGAAVLAIGTAATPNVAHAARYAFHVACPDRIFVVEWGVGDINPGREFLRATTGAQHPGCSVSDSDDARDRSLPKERHSDAGAVGDTIVTWVGKIFGF